MTRIRTYIHMQTHTTYIVMIHMWTHTDIAQCLTHLHNHVSYGCAPAHAVFQIVFSIQITCQSPNFGGADKQHTTWPELAPLLRTYMHIHTHTQIHTIRTHTAVPFSFLDALGILQLAPVTNALHTVLESPLLAYICGSLPLFTNREHTETDSFFGIKLGPSATFSRWCPFCQARK